MAVTIIVEVNELGNLNLKSNCEPPLAYWFLEIAQMELLKKATSQKIIVAPPGSARPS